MGKRWLKIVFTTTFFLVLSTTAALGQGAAPEESVPEESAVEGAIINNTASPPTAPEDGLYFADVMVRGQSVFQVGSLNNLPASERAAIISRRIASLLESTEGEVTVTTASVPDQRLINIQANDRVLMTVTEQDAQDFGLPLPVLTDDWAARLEQSFEKPPVAVDVIQRLDGTLRQLGKDAVNSIPALIGVIVVILITWLLAKGVRYSAFRWAQQTEGDHSTEVLIGRLGYGGVWIAGSVVALGVWGIDFATLLGALGLTSVAIGFSLKDVLSNYISGVILLAARPFHIGDQVVIEGYEGTIIQVQLRSTTLKTYDGRMIYLPNQEVFQAHITNNTAASYLRSSVMVGIDYDANIAQTRRVIGDAIATLENVQPDPLPEILVRELAASTVNLEVRFWVDSRRAGFLETTSIVAQTVKEALQQHHIEMPTEIYTLLIKDVPAPLKSNQKTITLDSDTDGGHQAELEKT
ncbi:MAG: mechanosensitive ion channel family protein [Cyanobacteria bacterium P01_A01_bin.15]